MTKRTFRPRPMIQKLSRVDQQRRQNQAADHGDATDDTAKVVEHRIRLKKRRPDAQLTPDDRRLLEDVPPHWYGRNQ